MALLTVLLLTGCTTPERSAPPTVEAIAPAAGGAAPEASVDWPEATSCAALVRALAALDPAVARALDPMTAPLVVASLGAEGLPVETDLPIPEVTAAELDAAPCAILAGAAVLLPAATDTILDRRTVHSAYPTGTKRRRNPEHQALEREIAKAKRSAPDDVDLIATGDPLLDLIGTVAGGIIGGIGAAAQRSDLRAAETELAATPAFIEDPILTSYRYEVVELEAERRLAVPVVLYDRALGRTAATTVTLTEQRRFAVADSRHPADVEPRQTPGVTPISAAELAAWRSTAPPLPTSTLLTHLAAVEPTMPPAPESLATVKAELAAPAPGHGHSADFGTGSDVPPGLPAELQVAVDTGPASAEPPRTSAANRPEQPALAEIVRVGADDHAGFYVTAEHALVPAEALGHSSLLVVRYPDGMRAHGLVELVDNELGLALVYLPRRGAALPLDEVRRPAPATTREPGLPWHDGDSIIGVFVTDPATSGRRWVDSPTLDRFVAELDTL